MKSPRTPIQAPDAVIARRFAELRTAQQERQRKIQHLLFSTSPAARATTTTNHVYNYSSPNPSNEGGQAFSINLENIKVLNSTLELIKYSTVCSANRQDETTSPKAVLCRVSHIPNATISPIAPSQVHQMPINSHSDHTMEFHRLCCTPQHGVIAQGFRTPHPLTAFAVLIAAAICFASDCHCCTCPFRTTLDQFLFA